MDGKHSAETEDGQRRPQPGEPEDRTDQRPDAAEQRSDDDEGDWSYGDSDDGQDYVDRSKIDFDPKDGLYSGTAVEGTSEIAGPHTKSEDGERSAEEMREEAKQQAEEAGADPEDTPAAKSPVARAAEKDDSDSGSSD